MAASAPGGTSDTPAWNPGKFALWSQRWTDPNDAAPTSVLLRHPTAPFRRIVEWADDDPMHEKMQKEMQKVAFAYLNQASELPDLDPPLGLPEEWLRALNPNPTPNDERWVAVFGWLPIGWPPEDFGATSTSADPFASFRVERTLPDHTPLPDQMVILLASERLSEQFLASEFGIRLVAHVHKRSSENKVSEYEVRITGMSASLPFGPYRTAGLLSEDWSAARASAFLTALLAVDRRQIEHRMPLDLRNVRFRGFRLARTIEGNNWQVERRGTTFHEPIAGAAKATPYSFVSLETLSNEGEPVGSGVSISKVPLIADATPGHARVFPIEPASTVGPGDIQRGRSTRTEKELNAFRKREKITDLQKEPLIYPKPSTGLREQMRVEVCPGFVLDDNPDPTTGKPQRGDAKEVDLPDTGPDKPFIRSNDFSAISAFKNVRQFFQRLDAYGIPVQAYFRVAKLPLKIFYRSGVRPGPGKDGQTVNARIRPEGWPVDLVGPTPLGQRPGLEMHLALANLSHRARKPWNHRDRSQAQPLGIAADARWIWHEIGHVLLMASVGELEFRFAHSPGDALAAIVADPDSKLADDPQRRGETFPWVFVPRRHDRCVSLGWSWGGSLRRTASLPLNALPRRKGYWSEQILSSSLFRLYLSLGGETMKAGSSYIDPIARESASHYSVYLIMSGIQILGTSGIVLANEPDQFVTALIDADIGTGQWNVTFPRGSATTFHRIGGCAHKVIRWAFEAQGMYTPPGTITNAPGSPPPVDIYIADGRPSASTTPYGAIQHGPGNYTPVSLHWDRNQGQADPSPLWQAYATAIDVQGNDIRVTVGNRGSQPAANVRVSVWWREWPGNTAPPDWHHGTGWTPCNPAVSPVQTIAPAASKTFGPFSHLPPGKRYLVLAQATCEDDLANTDPATSLPCSHLRTRLIELVPGDNNLGLRVIKNP